MVPAVPRLQHTGDISKLVSHTGRADLWGGNSLFIGDLGVDSAGAPEGLNEAI